MNQTTFIILSAILIIGFLVFLMFINQQKLKLQLEIKKLKEPNDELKNYQKELYELKRVELENRNMYDEKINEMKVNYERLFNNLKIELEKEKNTLKENLRAEKDYEFKRGLNQGINSSTLTVQVMPYKKVIKDTGFFSSNDFVEIGYKYQMFSNGIPCFDPHIQISESISIKEIKEENIHLIISKVDEIISKIPNPSIQVVGNVKDFGKSLLNLNKSKN